MVLGLKRIKLRVLHFITSFKVERSPWFFVKKGQFMFLQESKEKEKEKEK